MAKKKNRLLRIGVTGGIGGGKSIVSDLFRRHGAAVLSADEIARDLMDSNPQLQRKIRQRFGQEIFLEDGQLDRKKIARIVFENKKEREALNAIVHPIVLKEIKDRIEKLEEEERVSLVVHEAALIFEAEADRDLDYVVVVDSDEEMRIRRVMERDEISREEVVNRIRSQMPVSKKKELADFVIINNGDVAQLEKKVKFLYDLFMKISITS